MPNHLAGESSPYLQQHQDNPVDWYPWGAEALSRAEKEVKAIFLSIGYASCHWCHVMAHESFEDQQIANMLNANFISIKIDREERPDLDAIYMQAVILLTGQGGWPMSVFLTPDLKPFYGGTYFPPTPRYGMPSFGQVLQAVANAWQQKRTDILSNAQQITNAIQAQFRPEPPEEKPSINLDEITSKLYQSYDWERAGWGRAPKFPQPMLIDFLIQRASRNDLEANQLVNHYLERIARGGMYDLVGGGFHRYSVDDQWLIPHFEKMLYDNALLALAYIHAFSLMGEPRYQKIAEETLDFIQRELAHQDGGFYASLDADTPDGEGRYYAYTYQELQNYLPEKQFRLLKRVTTIKKEGNFENELNVLQLSEDPAVLSEILNIHPDELQSELKDIFMSLKHKRAERSTPRRDEKVITAWNALAVRAFAEAGLILGREDYRETAVRSMSFLLKELRSADGHLFRSWSQGKTSYTGTLEDYAGMILALNAVYQINFSSEYYSLMGELYQIVLHEFSSDGNLYFDTAETVSNLIVRPQTLQDNAMPSGNSLTAHAHWLFSNYEHNPEMDEAIYNMLAMILSQAQKYPTSFGYWLQVADKHSQSITQVALITESDINAVSPFLDIYRKDFRPYAVLGIKLGGFSGDYTLPGILLDRPSINGEPTAYVCKNFACKRPTSDPETFQGQMEENRECTNF